MRYREDKRSAIYTIKRLKANRERSASDPFHTDGFAQSGRKGDGRVRAKGGKLPDCRLISGIHLPYRGARHIDRTGQKSVSWVKAVQKETR